MNSQKVKNHAPATVDFGRKDRILVVDDDRSTRDLVAKMLSLKDYEVFTAKDASEALDLSAELSFDIVITDLEMPGVDGWELAKRIKERTEDTPVILMTGANEEMVRGRMKRSSVDAVIFKPFGLKEIQEAVNSTFDA